MHCWGWLRYSRHLNICHIYFFIHSYLLHEIRITSITWVTLAITYATQWLNTKQFPPYFTSLTIVVSRSRQKFNTANGWPWFIRRIYWAVENECRVDEEWVVQLYDCNFPWEFNAEKIKILFMWKWGCIVYVYPDPVHSVLIFLPFYIFLLLPQHQLIMCSVNGSYSSCTSTTHTCNDYNEYYRPVVYSLLPNEIEWVVFRWIFKSRHLGDS